MVTTVRPACFRDASYIVANMRKQDEDEILCQLPEGMKRHEIAYALLMGGGDAFVAINICTLSAWAIGTPRTWRVLVEATRFLIADYLPGKIAEGYSSMEARTHVEHRQSHGWLESTGAVVHGPPFVYGRNGEKFLLYRWTVDAMTDAAKRYKVDDHVLQAKDPSLAKPDPGS